MDSEFIKALNTPDAKLDPELEMYVQYVDKIGSCVRHPLIYSVPHNPVLNAVLNLQFQQKKKSIQEALETGNVTAYIWQHERPYRLSAFKEWLSDKERKNALEPSLYWGVVSSLWIDTEFPSKYQDEWLRLFKSKVPERSQHLMNQYERDYLLVLGDPITIYRGGKTAFKGMSWTTRIDTAEFFARRFKRAGDVKIVLVGKVPRNKVIAYLGGRNEFEIIVDPRYVEVMEQQVTT